MCEQLAQGSLYDNAVAVNSKPRPLHHKFHILATTLPNHANTC